jgi:hypothetical protein
MMRRMLTIFCAAILLFAASAARAEEEQGQSTMDIVRESLRADKKALIAANMDLSDTEGKAFWPVYDKYQKDLLTAMNKLYQVVVEYAQHSQKGDLTDEKAVELVNRMIAAEQERLKVRSSYVKPISKVLPGKKVARFFQLENKIEAVARYEMAAQIPLVKP